MASQILPMIGVTLLEDFVKNPPPYFQVQHCVRHPIIRPLPNRVNLCAHATSHEAWFPDSLGRVLKIETVEQYDELTQRLLSRPLVFNVKLERRHKSGRIRYILKCDIIVTVNTSHPIIKNQMQKLLDEGREDIVNGRNFAIDFNFDSILKMWFGTLHQGQDNFFDTSYDCTYARVVVTNSTEFNTMYSCSPEGVCIFITCLPCCIFMCPAYRIMRCLTTADHDCEVHGEVSYLTFKREQRSAQDELLHMFRQHLLRQMIQQVGRDRERPYLGVPEVTTQPVHGSGGDFPEQPSHLIQPYAGYPMGSSGHVEHPISPYEPPPAGYPCHPPQHLAQPGCTPQQLPCNPALAQPQGAGGIPTAQPELPSYDYVMRQTSDQDQLIT